MKIDPNVLMPRIDRKPWGYEEIWHVEGSPYVLKRLYVFADKRLSKQYHRVKDETIVLLSGHAEIEIDDRVVKLMPNQAIHVPPRTVHRIHAVHHDAILMEASTNELDDVVRLEDDYSDQERSAC